MSFTFRGREGGPRLHPRAGTFLSNANEGPKKGREMMEMPGGEGRVGGSTCWSDAGDTRVQLRTPATRNPREAWTVLPESRAGLAETGRPPRALV